MFFAVKHLGEAKPGFHRVLLRVVEPINDDESGRLGVALDGLPLAASLSLSAPTLVAELIRM
jgi:hypothetical protein